MPVVGVLAAVEVGVLDSVGSSRVVKGRSGFGKLPLKIIGIDMVLLSSPINAQLPMQSRSMIPKVFLRLSFMIFSTKQAHTENLILPLISVAFRPYRYQ
jgi:hypothetical protein